MDATATFEEHRAMLFGVAYRILGRAMEAEDVVQDGWLRWREVEHAEIESPKAFLVRVVTRLSIDRLRQARARRETYVGAWLPEPVLTTSDVADNVALADTVSLGMLRVLESLSPSERAVFVLREAFDFPYPEIAGLLDRTEQSVRQLAKRARDHVREGRPRFDADRSTHQAVTRRFLHAATSGDVDQLLQVLAPDVVLHSDGGGVQKAPLRVIVGADKVGRFLAAIAHESVPDPEIYLAPVNGNLAVVALSRGELHTVLALDVSDEQITAIHLLTNPDKLRALADVRSAGVRIPL